MSTWKLSTREKKSCTQIEFFKKDNMIAQREIGWRWCWAIYNEKPDLSEYDSNKDQIELYTLGDIQDMEQDDGCWEDWTWPEELGEVEAERLSDIYEEEGDEGLENEGWILEDTEYWVSGPLDVEQEIKWYIDGTEPLVVVDHWTQDDLRVEHRVTYAATHAEFGTKPDLTGYDSEDQMDITALDIPVLNFRNGKPIEDVWEFPEDMPKKEKNWFKKHSWDKWVKAGWHSRNTQVWVTGELTITKDEEE